MLSIHIITVGRDKDKWITDQINHFQKLISKYARLELTSVPESKYGSSVDIKKAKSVEAKSIKSRLKGGQGSLVIALDVKGKEFGTKALANYLIKLQNDGKSTLEFVIGGPHGLDKQFIESTDLQMSLSPLTMSHQIIRLVLLEQLYRVLNINAGGSYHK